MIYFHISVYCTIGTFITLCCFFFFQKDSCMQRYLTMSWLCTQNPLLAQSLSLFFCFWRAVMFEAPFLFVMKFCWGFPPHKKRNFPRPHQIKLRRDWVMTPPQERNERKLQEGIFIWSDALFPLWKRERRKKKEKKLGKRRYVDMHESCILSRCTTSGPAPSSLTPFKRSHL